MTFATALTLAVALMATPSPPRDDSDWIKCVDLALSLGGSETNVTTNTRHASSLTQLYSSTYKEAERSTNGDAFLSKYWADLGYSDERRGEERFEEDKLEYRNESTSYLRRSSRALGLTGDEIARIIEACGDSAGIRVAYRTTGTLENPEQVIITITYPRAIATAEAMYTLSIIGGGTLVAGPGLERDSTTAEAALKVGLSHTYVVDSITPRAALSIVVNSKNAQTPGALDVEFEKAKPDNTNVKNDILYILAFGEMPHSIESNYTEAELFDYLCRGERAGFGGCEYYSARDFHEAFADLIVEGIVLKPTDSSHDHKLRLASRIPKENLQLHADLRAEMEDAIRDAKAELATEVNMKSLIERLRGKHNDRIAGKTLGWLALTEQFRIVQDEDRFDDLRVVEN